MHFIPLFKVRDMRVAIRFYTEVLDFRMTWPEDAADSPVVDLGHETMEFQITTHASERLFGSVVYVYVPDVDSLFAKFKNRGLDTSVKCSLIRQYTRDRLIRPGAEGNSMSLTRTETHCAIASQ